MNLSLEQLQAEVAKTGFQIGTLDKVVRLIDLLDAFQKHPFLRDRLVLKGGTALNLFVFDMLRLSVDIDLNYVGSTDREVMLTEKEPIKEAIAAICESKGFTVHRTPGSYAGGKWRFRYTDLQGRDASLEIDVVFTSRVPLWAIQARDSHPVGGLIARDIPVLDAHELAAGKLVALFTRTRQASRDLFDAHALLGRDDLDLEKLRLSFVVYGAYSRKDVRYVSPDNISYDYEEFERQLMPVLSELIFQDGVDPEEWIEQRLHECRERTKLVLPFRDNEMEFLARVNERGEVCPELLTEDAELAERIRQFPHLQWKVQNIRKRKS